LRRRTHAHCHPRPQGVCALRAEERNGDGVLASLRCNPIQEKRAYPVDLMAESSTDVAVFAAKARIPAHVVFRSFPRETVVLNLDTGKYHGLNPTAGRMLEVLQQAETVERAAERLAEEYVRSLEEIRRDLYDLCVQLRARGLLEILSHDGNAV